MQRMPNPSSFSMIIWPLKITNLSIGCVCPSTWGQEEWSKDIYGVVSFPTICDSSISSSPTSYTLLLQLVDLLIIHPLQSLQSIWPNRFKKPCNSHIWPAFASAMYCQQAQRTVMERMCVFLLLSVSYTLTPIRQDTNVPFSRTATLLRPRQCVV